MLHVCMHHAEREREKREKKVAHPHPSLLFFPLLSAILFPLFPARVYRPTRPRVLVLSASYTHIYIRTYIRVRKLERNSRWNISRVDERQCARAACARCTCSSFFRALNCFSLFPPFLPLPLYPILCVFFARARLHARRHISAHTPRSLSLDSITFVLFYFLARELSLSLPLALRASFTFYLYTSLLGARSRVAERLVYSDFSRSFNRRARGFEGGWGLRCIYAAAAVFHL